MSLEKAKFVNNNDNQTIVVQFNPSSLSISTTADISEQKSQLLGNDKSVVNASGISNRQLRMSLILDSYRDESLSISNLLSSTKKEDVKTVIDKFENFMSTSVDISFIWGKIIFTGVIQSISYQYKMFDSNGSPVRASLEIDMQETSSENQQGLKSFNLDDFNLDNLNEEDLLSSISSLGSIF